MACRSEDISHKIACIVVDNEVLTRIMDKVRTMLKVSPSTNIREVDRLFEHYLL
jgi:hypothetical protein